MNDDQLDDLLHDAAGSYNVPPPVPRDLMWARIEAARRDGGTQPRAARRAAPWLRTAIGVAAVLLAGIAIGRVTRVREPDRVAPRIADSAPAAAPARATGAAAVAATARPGAPPSADPYDARPALAGRVPRATVGGRGARVAPPTLRASAPRDAAVARGRDGRTYGVPRNTPGVIGEGTEMNVHRLAVVEHLARTEVLLTGFRARERADGRLATPADAEQFGRLSRELLQNTRLLLATRATDDPLLQRLLEDLELVLMQIAQYAADGGARRGDLDAINQSLDRRNVLPKLRSTIPAGAPAPSGT